MVNFFKRSGLFIIKFNDLGGLFKLLTPLMDQKFKSSKKKSFFYKALRPCLTKLSEFEAFFK